MTLRERQLRYVKELSAKAGQSPTYWAKQLGYPHSQIQKLMSRTIDSIGGKSWQKLEALTGVTIENFFYDAGCSLTTSPALKGPILEEEFAGISTPIDSLIQGSNGASLPITNEERLLHYFRALAAEDQCQVIEFAAIRLAGGKSLREMVVGIEGMPSPKLPPKT